MKRIILVLIALLLPTISSAAMQTYDNGDALSAIRTKILANDAELYGYKVASGSITGSNLTLVLDDTSTIVVDVSSLLDNTDAQTVTAFSLNSSTNVLTITLSGGNTQTVDLSGLVSAGGLTDADSDGTTYGRKDGEWVAVGTGTGEANVQSDYTQTNTGADDYIKNKPALFDGAYGSLTGTPTIPTLTSDLSNDSGFLGSNPNIGIATGTSLTVTGSLNVPAFNGTTYAGTDVAAGLQAALTEIDGATEVTASTYILTLFDDADAATARTTLGVDPIGTDNSDNNAVNTLYSGLVSNVTTTMDGITPGTGVVNALGNAVNGASGVVVLAASPGTPDGTKVLRDDGTWVANGTVSSESSSYDFVYYDVQATDTGYIFRVPTGATPVWDTAYSWCDGAEAALVYTVYYSATFGGTFSSLGTIAHSAEAETDSIDVSGFTDPTAGGWLRVDITTPGTTASKCTLSIEVD